MKRRIPWLKFVPLLALWFACSSGFEVKAQTCTIQNSPQAYQPGWIKGADVQVYIDPAITGDQRNAVIDAFNNWNAANGSDGTNSGVDYTIVSSPPPAGSYSFTVNSTAPTTYPGTRAETGTVTDAYGHTIGATTKLDPQVTNPDAIREVIAHEIGHPAGLDDCYSCATGDSVMGGYWGGQDYNEVIGRPTSPTNCDKHNLQASDYPYCNPPVNTSDCQVWDPNTCTCSQYVGGGGGGGGEPGSKYALDGCTDYYWCYFVSYDGGSTWQLYDVEYAGCFY